MGYSLSWLAIKTGKPQPVYSIVSVRLTGQREEIPESDIVSAELPTGWQLVVFMREELEDKTLVTLSTLGHVVYCFVEDHVMFSKAAFWTNGRCTWSVTHDSEKGQLHLEATGRLPASFATIRDQQFAREAASGEDDADVDYIYEIPAELAKDITGYRHDEEIPEMSGKGFQVLARSGGGALPGAPFPTWSLIRIPIAAAPAVSLCTIMATIQLLTLSIPYLLLLLKFSSRNHETTSRADCSDSYLPAFWVVCSRPICHSS